MKKEELYNELNELASNNGITVRRGTGSFKSAYCVLNETKTIIFNKSTTVEVKTAILARCLNDFGIMDMFIKPQVREFLEQEKKNRMEEKTFSLEVDFDEWTSEETI